MTEKIKFLKPREGLLVRNPVTRELLPADGAFVEWTGRQGNYWRRRVMCGDCIISAPPTKKKQVIEEQERSK